MNRRSHAVALALLAVLTACGGGATEASGTGPTETTLNLGPPVDYVPERKIPEGSGPGETEFLAELELSIHRNVYRGLPPDEADAEGHALTMGHLTCRLATEGKTLGDAIDQIRWFEDHFHGRNPPYASLRFLALAARRHLCPGGDP